MNFKHYAKITALLLACMLSSCILPGSSVHTKQAVNADESSTPVELTLLKITPQLLAKQANVTKPSAHAARSEANHYEYKIGIGDVLNIIVWDHPELSIPQGSERNAEDSGNQVHANGNIFYPYVGELPVVGKSLIEVRQQLTAKLSKYIHQPQVDVAVAAYRSQYVYVSGAVEKPAKIAIENVPLYLIGAINAAGGFSEFADLDNISLIRDGKQQQLSARAIVKYGDLRQDMRLHAGDIINVASLQERRAYILGEVPKPSSVIISNERLSLIDAISAAGGLEPNSAKASGIFVFRATASDPSATKATVYQLDASDAAAFLLAERFELQPKDVVYVTSLPLARWNRLIEQISPTAVLYRTLDVK